MSSHDAADFESRRLAIETAARILGHGEVSITNDRDKAIFDRLTSHIKAERGEIESYRDHAIELQGKLSEVDGELAAERLVVEELRGEVERLRGEVGKLLGGSVVTLECEEPQPISCSQCGHVGNVKINVQQVLADYLNECVKKEGERIDAEWAEKVEACRKHMADGSALLTEAAEVVEKGAALTAERDALQARLGEAVEHLAWLMASVVGEKYIGFSEEESTRLTEIREFIDRRDRPQEGVK